MKSFPIPSCLLLAILSVGCDDPQTTAPRESHPVASGSRLHAKVHGEIVPVWRDENGVVHLTADITYPDSVLVEPTRAMAARQASTAGNPASTLAHRWTDGVIPYEIEPGHPMTQFILDAMADWSIGTGVRFVPATAAQIASNANRAQFVTKITQPGSCTIQGYGREGVGAQAILLNPICETQSPGITRQYLSYLIGMFPLEMRPDRDQFAKTVVLAVRDCAPGDNYCLYNYSS